MTLRERRSHAHLTAGVSARPTQDRQGLAEHEISRHSYFRRLHRLLNCTTGVALMEDPSMSTELPVDPVALREEVKSKYRDVARNPNGEHHFHTGRPLARRLGYDQALVDSMPDAAVESFAGGANPFALRALDPGEKVVDAGS